MAHDLRLISGQADRPATHAHLVQFVNHELRTPLAVVVGHTEMLHELAADLPEAAQSSLAAIARASERLRVVADMFSQLGDLEVPCPAVPVAVSPARGSA